MFSVILTYFDFVFESFLTLWGPNGVFLGMEKGSKTVLGSTYVVKQLPFTIFLSILTFDFDFILGPFLPFFGP